MQAAILSIGDELVLGQTVDTNSAWLSARLAQRGIMTKLHATVADDRALIADEIRRAVDAAELVIVTGGLGPTEDDLTRFALADAMGVGLALDEVSLGQIAAFFQKRRRGMPDRNRVQAMCPLGARMLANRSGTAPGIHTPINDSQVWVVPGVPREMRTLWDDHIAPALPTAAGRTILTTKINTFGAGESDVAAMLGDLAARDRNPLVGTTVADGIVSVRIRSEFDTADEAQRQLDQTIEQVLAALSELVFSRDDVALAAAVGAMLQQRGQTLALAESCTGGLIGQMITDAPGSSAYFIGGWITYANAMKISQLGVDEALIEQHGAVSAPVAEAMARGALERSDADHAVSITGIAGPDGGTDDKPVGTVYIGLASRRVDARASHHVLAGDRPNVRRRAALTALNLLRLRLTAPGRAAD